MRDRLAAVVGLVVVLVVASQVPSAAATAARGVSFVGQGGTAQAATSIAAAMTIRPNAVSAGYFHSCAVKSDWTLACWGRNNEGQATPPSGRFQQVSMGPYHSCAIKMDGKLACWGSNISGGATPPGGTFQQVSAGWYHGCGIKSNGTLACWGRNDEGQATPPSGAFKQISLGGYYSCGIKSDETLICWGANWYGQTAAPSGTFKQISAGGSHGCGIKSDDTIACWGLDDYGQATPPDDTFQQVSAGAEYSCGIKNDGTLMCWGLDDGLRTPPDGTFQQIAVGLYHSCAIRSDLTIACWGHSNNGQLTVPSGYFGLCEELCLAVQDVSLEEGTTSSQSARFVVALSSPSTTTVTVDYATADGSAKARADYTAKAGKLTFPAGTIIQTAIIAVRGDNLDELDETFLLTLSNPTNASLLRTQAIGTIDDDDGPGVTIDDALLLEGSSGIHDAFITVALSSRSVQTITVPYVTGDGTATPGSDYRRRLGRLVFSPGETRKVIRIAVVGDPEEEDDETFNVVLGTPIDASLADGSATVTLLDDDPDAPVDADALVREGAGGVRYAYFEVSLSQAQPTRVTVRMATADGTAKAGEDYQGRRETLVFEPGQTSRLVAVAVSGDTLLEDDESFQLLLTPPAGVTMVDAELIGLIVNDD